jgi:cytochrome c oxidase subunit 2
MFVDILEKSIVNCCLDYVPLAGFIPDPTTPIMIGVMNLHHTILFLEIGIGIIVFWLLGSIVYYFRVTRITKEEPFPDSRYANSIRYTNPKVLEIVWTLLPAFILVLITIPSFKVLYSSDILFEPTLTIKIIGQQWYWHFEYSDYVTSSKSLNSIARDVHVLEKASLLPGELRTLEVDNRIVIPVNTHVRFIVGSGDVLHAFNVPALGIKIDAIPGRLNMISTFVVKEGVYFGACAELCGVNHGYMPITIEAVTNEEFTNWIATMINSSSN